MTAVFDRPGSSAAGDSIAEGTATATARSDHKHGREAADANLSATAGNISQVDSGDAASAGALTTGARSDHQHAVPTPAVASTSAVGDAATTGSLTTLARGDHKHAREAFATTSDIADVAATESAGSAATVAHGDHVHALPALAGWTTYTPTWTASTTNPTIGNGVLTGAYAQFGKTVHFRIFLAFGSGTTVGSGVYSFTLPVTSTAVANEPGGQCLCRDASVPTFVMRHVFLPSSTTVNATTEAGVRVTDATPFAWATSDTIIIGGTYEAA